MAEKKEDNDTLFGMINGMPLRIPIIGFVGGHGAGKTIAGASLSPTETTEIAVEDSAVSFNFPFAKTHSMFKEVKSKKSLATPSPLDCWLWFRELLPTIETRLVFIDPITDLQAGCYQYVVENCSEFGLTSDQCIKSSGLVWGAVKSLMKMTLGCCSQKVESVLYTSHLGLVWKNGKPVPGKLKAKGVTTFYEMSSLIVYLQREVDSKTGKRPAIPVGHVTSPLGKERLGSIYEKEDGSWGVVPVLPPRIKEFNWTNFRKYVDSPPDYSKLKPHEKADVDVLSDDDKLLLKAEIADAERETEQLKNERIAATEEAQRSNSRSSAPKKKAPEKPKESKKKEPVKTEDLPTQKKQTDASAAGQTLDDADRIVIIKENAKKLWGDKALKFLKASVARRNGEKLSDLSTEQLIEIQDGICGKLGDEAVPF